MVDVTQGKKAGAAAGPQGNGAEKGPLPAIAAPKGGGAIRGIGEKFQVAAPTGTGSLTVPLPLSPGRSGFEPRLNLSYDSGAGNGAFGFGWSLNLPTITRKTDKGLPRYLDEEESDVFILSGAEDLVPLLDALGNRLRATRTVHGVAYQVCGYRPRIEGLFARIERWCALETGISHWRCISSDNVTTLYGFDGESVIADPTDPRKIFSYLPRRSFDDAGNVMVYGYAAEDSTGVDLTAAHEANRTTGSRAVQRYLKSIKYGNAQPYQADWSQDGAGSALPSDWRFEVVFDYGDHNADAPNPTPDPQSWPARPDPFSRYRAGFEVRTYRRCTRVLMFHNFPQEQAVGADCLVRSLDFAYSDQKAPTDPSNPIYTFVASITQNGYRRQGPGYLRASMPPLEFEYSVPQVQPDELTLDPDSLANLPEGMEGGSYRWVDLDGEGSSGILADVGNAWVYKRNLSAANRVKQPDGSVATRAKFGPVETLRTIPSHNALNTTQRLMDLSADGRLDVVTLAEPDAGYFERTEGWTWAPLARFARLPQLDWADPNVTFVDLTGDGLADILLTEDGLYTLWRSQGTHGFDPPQQIRTPWDEERGPKVVLADGTNTIFLADMTGDGQSDLVRIRNGEVCDWPNLGYGRFGPKVTMDGAPRLNDEGRYDPSRVRLADIDGSGTADLLYVGDDGVSVCFNRSGNGWAQPQKLAAFPSNDPRSCIDAVDLLGTGTACLVWSSPLPSAAPTPLRYVDLMGGQKPHLLITVRNNLCAETRITYASSTRFYVADKLAGQPWITSVHFPVQVVERVETYDYVSRSRFVTRYAYHHGNFDGIEREFRGFGMVEERDTEELGVLSQSGALPAGDNFDDGSYVPPVLTKTWYHTGAYRQDSRVSRIFAEEYYRESDLAEGVSGLTDAEFEAMQLPDSVLPPGITGDEVREALRSLKGAVVRQEIYALEKDTAEADRPYIVSERNYTIRPLQPFGPNRHAVFLTHARESIEFHYERKLYAVGTRQLADPRVSHTLVLAVDDYGNELQSAAVGYGRRHDDPDPLLATADRAEQKKPRVTYTESGYTNPTLAADAYRTPLPAEARTYELIKVTPQGNRLGVTDPSDITLLFGFDEMTAKVSQAGDGRHELPYEDLAAAGATEEHPYRRLIEQVRTLYRKDDLSAGLPLGRVESRALPFESYKLAFTPGLLAAVYRRGQENLLPDPVGVLRWEGGYALSDDQKALGLFPGADPDGHWWVPSGRVFYSANYAATAAQELADAQAHFFLPRRFKDPFGNEATVLYDPYDLLALETEDALQSWGPDGKKVSNGNKVTAGERALDGKITNKNDYRVLQPSLLTDPNGNRSAVAFDALGLLVGTAVMGKATETLGDSLDWFVADLTQAQIDGFFGDPKGPPAANLLGNATTRIVYDLERFARAPSTLSSPKPVYAATIVRETHVSDLAGQASKLQVSVSYFDGFGRAIQRKLRAEPGPLVANGPRVDTRWVGSGWTIFNNKGKPVRQYEPFFDDTHDFKFGLTVGVSPVLFYDPVGRVVATLHPNHAWEKVVFDPWRQATFDVNDTVLNVDGTTDPKRDADVQGFFKRLPNSDYLPTWSEQRSALPSSDPEHIAADKAAVHRQTPTVAHFDALGRPFLTIAQNRFDWNGTTIEESYPRRVELDVEGNKRAVRDAVVQNGDNLGRIVMRYDYDMLGSRIHQASMEAGERWMLDDVTGKPIRGWDSRRFLRRMTYDELRRPTGLFVTENDAERLAERTVYGEGQPSPEKSNLRAKAFQVFDGAGLVTSEPYDFKGNLLQSRRNLLPDYKHAVDWSQNPAADDGTFSTATTYDALNRPVTVTTPDGSIYHPTYNEANLLEKVEVNLRGAAAATPFITKIDYNEKGQRKLIVYGNGAQTSYDYDRLTFRLTWLHTTRPVGLNGLASRLFLDPSVVQDLRYTYDPVGNITWIADASLARLSSSGPADNLPSDYTYDAIYRLIEATGREHAGQTAHDSNPQNRRDYDFVGLADFIAHPNDLQAVRRCTQSYEYAAAGNFELMRHVAEGGNWTRRYAYQAASLIEPAKQSNRLTMTTLGNSFNGTETYVYTDAQGQDVHGCMTAINGMKMVWDFKDQLQQVDLGGGGTAYYVYDAAGQRVRKVMEDQKGTRQKERVYLGAFESYREFDGNGVAVTPTLTRESLHVMDDKQRIALVETKIAPVAGQPILRYQFGNHLSSASVELDQDGGLISYEEYRPYGTTVLQAGHSAAEVSLKRYRYNGKERDEETGLYYHGVRYYASWLGRWIACDPLYFVDGANLYAAFKDTPVTLLDPTGAQTKKPPTVVTMPDNSKALSGYQADAPDLQTKTSDVAVHQEEQSTAPVLVQLGPQGATATIHPFSFLLSPLHLLGAIDPIPPPDRIGPLTEDMERYSRPLTRWESRTPLLPDPHFNAEDLLDELWQHNAEVEYWNRVFAEQRFSDARQEAEANTPLPSAVPALPEQPSSRREVPVEPDVYIWELRSVEITAGRGGYRGITEPTRQTIREIADRYGVTGPVDVAHRVPHVFTQPGQRVRAFAQRASENRSEGPDIARAAAARRLWNQNNPSSIQFPVRPPPSPRPQLPRPPVRINVIAD
jgi:RHS repeat-associated protein